MNPNDRIREQILQYFYDRNAAATSKTGKKGSGVKISDVKYRRVHVHPILKRAFRQGLVRNVDQPGKLVFARNPRLVIPTNLSESLGKEEEQGELFGG